jgi:hypothetical protein
MPGYNSKPKSGLPGHGRTIPRERAMRPLLRADRRSRDGSYLKTWGSTPKKVRGEAVNTDGKGR